MSQPMLTTAECARLACVWEATARKAGNVHPERDFADLRYDDFLASAAAIAPVLGDAVGRPLGQTMLRAVEATRAVTATNSNLGIILLLAPLAAVSRDVALANGVGAVLHHLTNDDARLTYQAIRLARPGGMGESPQEDIAQEPACTLLEAMRLAAERDMVARQYASDFYDVLTMGVPYFQKLVAAGMDYEPSIQSLHLHWMATHPDSLIARKRGLAEAEEAGRRARAVLDAGFPGTTLGRGEFTDLDAWLTAEGNRRNPGTSADLTTACLFVALREGRVAAGSWVRMP